MLTMFSTLFLGVFATVILTLSIIGRMRISITDPIAEIRASTISSPPFWLAVAATFGATLVFSKYFPFVARSLALGLALFVVGGLVSALVTRQKRARHAIGVSAVASATVYSPIFWGSLLVCLGLGVSLVRAFAK